MLLLFLASLLLRANAQMDPDSSEEEEDPVPRLIVPMPAHKSESVRDVLSRLPSWVNEQFAVIEIDEGVDQLLSGSGEIDEMEDGRLLVRATTPTNALFVINAYLRQYCDTLITWSGSHFGECKRRLTNKFVATGPRVRYFGNQRTFSYSFPWWTWSEWEPFIDWLALNGMNMVLAPIGQEYVYRTVWMEMGIPEEEIDTFFTGDAFLAWHRMGNLKHLGGGVSVDHLKKQLELNKKIVARLFSLGIVPVLPTFAGFVPDAFVRKFPETQFIKNRCWNNFNESNTCLYSVSPSESLFQDIAGNFIKKQKEIYGDVTSVYSADPFNENAPQLFDALHLRKTSESIWRGCKRGNENCVWLLPSSMFNGSEWDSDEMLAFLSGVPVGSLLVLDFHAETKPMYKSTESFFGHFYVWCLLHNFGGSRQLRGNFDVISTGYDQARRSNLRMVGGGLTMEAINQNYVIYQFFIDQMWSNLALESYEWLPIYTRSRYGNSQTSLVDRVWRVIAETIYSEPAGQDRFNLFIYERPSLSAGYDYWYDVYKIKALYKTLKQLNETLGSNALFKRDYHDLLRTTKEYEIATGGVDRVREGYALNDSRILKSGCEKLDRMFDELDQLAHDPNNNLVTWLASARSMGSTAQEGKRLEKQALYQVTLWGPNGEGLDYARKEWSGLIRKYYAKRWRFLCEYVSGGIFFKQKKFNMRVIQEIEKPFAGI